MRVLALFFLVLSAHLSAVQNGPLFMAEGGYEILFENRLLAQVNGKPITVYDVMKKMDVVFYRQYPEYVTNKQARFQFYQVSWKSILKDLIEKELMMADAGESKLEVTASEVRQELEKSFGPNIIANLDKIDMTLDEAKEILQSEILIRKLMGFKVTGKAYRSINPQDLKEAYAAWTKENVAPDQIVYRVLTIRDGKDGERCKSVVSLIDKWLKEGKGDLAAAKSAFERLGILSESTKISLSEPLKVTRDELLPEIKAVIDQLGEKEFSEPIVQKSRRDDSTVWKIYALEEVIEPAPISFKEIESKLRDKLLDQRITKEASDYLSYLRNHYSVYDSYMNQVAKEWLPFSLIQLKNN
jgi:hypothetical protein